MSFSISNDDIALKLLLAVIPGAQKDLSVETVADQLSSLCLVGHEQIEGTNSIAQMLAAKYDASLAGKTEVDQAEVSQWMTISARHGPSERQVFSQTINEHLAGRTYLVSSHLSLADLVAFANVYPYMDSLSAQKRFNWSNFSRWYDLIQNTVSAEALEKAGIKRIEIDLNAPVPAKKEKKNASGKENAAGAAANSKDKRQKKEKKPKAQAAPKEKLEIVPSLIDLRVGHIVEAGKHPDADSLYVEKIDAGEESPREVVSGLVRFMTVDQVQGRDVVLVCNLKPASMRGIKSYAMVLCATSPDGNTVEFVEPPKGSKPGDRVYFEGFENGKPEEVLKPKLKIFETIQPGLFTDDNRIAGWYNEEKKFHRLLVNGQECTTATVAKGSLK